MITVLFFFFKYINLCFCYAFGNLKCLTIEDGRNEFFEILFGGGKAMNQDQGGRG